MEDMEPLFRGYGVNLVLSGHNHAYVRTHSLMYGNATVDTSGRSPIYLTVGTGGDSHSAGPIYDTPEPWVAARDHSTFGAGRLEVVNATHALWERLLVEDDDDDARVDGNPPRDDVDGLRDPVWFVNHHTYL